jgi:dolichol-phosphate mannosyltransferase
MKPEGVTGTCPARTGAALSQARPLRQPASWRANGEGRIPRAPMSETFPELSVVVPVKDEAGNVRPLIGEIVKALDGLVAFEIVYVDDGSKDETPAVLEAAKAEVAQLRVLRHTSNAGQSAGLRSGVRAARGRLIATLDGDGQNDPADIAKLLARYHERAVGAPVRMVAGQRVKRQDTWSKRWASKIANRVRRFLLKDDTRDTGCGLKLFERQAFLDLPYFDHIHRYLPALMKREGYAIALEDVGHRPRGAGQSKYTNLSRAIKSVPDLIGMRWLMTRRRPTGEVREI